MVTITISGSPGSGKTTVAKLLGKKLGLTYVYTGDIFRKLAKKYNMSLEAFGRYCENHREIDEELDRHQLEILQKGNVIVEGRISGWIAHRNNIRATKVLLDADIETRANRIVKRENGDAEKRKHEVVTREKSEATRYKNYYNIDITDSSIYDLVIDTSALSPEEIVQRIMRTLGM
jgi:predicted cytidylate kinase